MIELSLLTLGAPDHRNFSLFIAENIRLLRRTLFSVFFRADMTC